MARTPSWSPNDNVTVIKSRPVQYLLMKLRDRGTVGRVSWGDLSGRIAESKCICILG